MHRSKYIGAALVGLLVVAAISVAAGSGRKPANEQATSVSLRPLSAGETMDILRRFPEMVPSYLASSKNDTNELARIYGLLEVTSPMFARVFPADRFYIGHDFYSPPHPYPMAIAGNTQYRLGDFNRLVIDNGLKVTDKNIIELAKAFVIMAIGGEQGSFSEIAFLDATRTRQAIGGISYDAKLKVRVGEQVEEWYFDSYFNQFRVISRGSERGLIRQYNPAVVEPLPERGQRGYRGR